MRKIMLIAAVLCVFMISGCKKPVEMTNNRGICGVNVIYSINMSVNDEADAQMAFQRYVDYLNTHNLTPGEYEKDITFKEVSYYGVYKEIRYWGIVYHYISPQDDSEGNSMFHVSENGEIVRVLGCI